MIKYDTIMQMQVSLRYVRFRYFDMIPDKFEELKYAISLRGAVDHRFDPGLLKKSISRLSLRVLPEQQTHKNNHTIVLVSPRIIYFSKL